MAKRGERLILASASVARATLLRQAGVEFVIEPANVDEASAKRAAQRDGRSAIDCALMLAIEKAAAVSREHPDAVVIGADQILTCGGEWFDKPADVKGARAQLAALRGRTHSLATAVCAVQRGIVLWQAKSEPELTMREFSEAFLDTYIVAESESLLGSVGGYRLEGWGAQLFSRMNGDYFAILGLPLIELLGFLRGRGIIAA